MHQGLLVACWSCMHLFDRLVCIIPSPEDWSCGSSN